MVIRNSKGRLLVVGSSHLFEFSVPDVELHAAYRLGSHLLDSSFMQSGSSLRVILPLLLLGFRGVLGSPKVIFLSEMLAHLFAMLLHSEFSMFIGG